MLLGAEFEDRSRCVRVTSRRGRCLVHLPQENEFQLESPHFSQDDCSSFYPPPTKCSFVEEASPRCFRINRIICEKNNATGRWYGFGPGDRNCTSRYLAQILLGRFKRYRFSQPKRSLPSTPRPRLSQPISYHLTHTASASTGRARGTQTCHARCHPLQPPKSDPLRPPVRSVIGSSVLAEGTKSPHRRMQNEKRTNQRNHQ